MHKRSTRRICMSVQLLRYVYKLTFTRGSTGSLASKFSVFQVVVLQSSVNDSSVLRVVSVWRLYFTML